MHWTQILYLFFLSFFILLFFAQSIHPSIYAYSVCSVYVFVCWWKWKQEIATTFHHTLVHGASTRFIFSSFERRRRLKRDVHQCNGLQWKLLELNEETNNYDQEYKRCSSSRNEWISDRNWMQVANIVVCFRWELFAFACVCLSR